MRLCAFVIVLASLITAVAVLGQNGGASSIQSPLPPESSVNMIAYVDHNGHIYTVRPDGTDPVKISPGEDFFTWPMWSPDGAQLLFSGVTSVSAGSLRLGMYAYGLKDGQLKLIFENEPGMGPILNRMPHYPLWSPDGGHLFIMASHPQGLALYLDDRADDSSAKVILWKRPLYATWSPDSRYILVHGGPDLLLVDLKDGVSVDDLGIVGGNYRAPAWWPSGGRFAFVTAGGNGMSSLYLADVDSNDRVLLEELPGSVAFGWSPSGELLAVARSERPGGLIYRDMALYTPQGNRQSVEIQEAVLAFFWSPDSAMLAYVTLAETRGALRWMVLDVADGSRWPLVDFIGSPDQLNMFQFFDQFAHSHSPWSPDSDALVFAGSLLAEGVSASLNQQPAQRIFVVDADGGTLAEPIADGFLAVWSPR